LLGKISHGSHPDTANLGHDTSTAIAPMPITQTFQQQARQAEIAYLFAKEDPQQKNQDVLNAFAPLQQLITLDRGDSLNPLNYLTAISSRRMIALHFRGMINPNSPNDANFCTLRVTIDKAGLIKGVEENRQYRANAFKKYAYHEWLATLSPGFKGGIGLRVTSYPAQLLYAILTPQERTSIGVEIFLNPAVDPTNLVERIKQIIENDFQERKFRISLAAMPKQEHDTRIAKIDNPQIKEFLAWFFNSFRGYSIYAPWLSRNHQP
jgi:hypothetical protein